MEGQGRRCEEGEVKEGGIREERCCVREKGSEMREKW